MVFGKTGDALGASVTTGDVNGGGSIDLILGAPLANRTAITGVTAASDTGAVFGIFGGTNLTPAVGTSKTFDLDAGQQNVSVYGADASDHLGVSVATGDVTGDGTVDLLAGAPDADGFSGDRASGGEAYVVQGGAGLNPDVGSEKRVDLLTGGAAATMFGAASGDRLGSTVAAGNYSTAENSDNIPDLIAGAPGANNRAGIVAIVFGGPNLLLFPNRDVLLGQDDLRVVGQSGVNNDLVGQDVDHKADAYYQRSGVNTLPATTNGQHKRQPSCCERRYSSPVCAGYAHACACSGDSHSGRHNRTRRS